MPCRDYGSDDYSFERSLARRANETLFKERADMLARIACKAMYELEKDPAKFDSLMKDEELNKWWTVHREQDRKNQLARMKEELKKKEQSELKKRAYAKLTEEERQVLGLTKKTARK